MQPAWAASDPPAGARHLAGGHEGQYGGGLRRPLCRRRRHATARYDARHATGRIGLQILFAFLFPLSRKLKFHEIEEVTVRTGTFIHKKFSSIEIIFKK
jgi:hypothetical protein